MLTMAPSPLVRRNGVAALLRTNAVVTLKWNERSRKPALVSRNGRGIVPPALFTTTSTRPNSPVAAATISSTASLSFTSVGSTSASRPNPRTSAATSSSCSLVRAASTTLAPASAKVRAIAAPMPRPAPVTIATFPSSRKASTALT
jgi:hypothetical protein